MERKIVPPFEYNQDRIWMHFDLWFGVEEYEKFGIAVRGRLEARGKGREAITILQSHLQEVANHYQTKVTHIVEPETPDAKKFFRKSREKHGQYIEEVWMEGTRFFIETFEPKTKRT